MRGRVSLSPVWYAKLWLLATQEAGMFKVIVSTPRGNEAQSFPEKPAAMNYAVRALKREGASAKVTIEDAAGVVFEHPEIERASEAVRL